MIDPASFLTGLMIGLLFAAIVIRVADKNASRDRSNPSTGHKIERPDDIAGWTP